MVFSSITFLFVFLPIFLAVYYLLDRKLKNYWLLLSSLFFYYWGEPGFLKIMLISILWNYICGLLCGHWRKQKTIRAGVLLFAVLGNLGLLFYYKYLNFIVKLINAVFPLKLPLYEIVLPIGISFFTFQGLSYVIDVSRGTIVAQKNPLKLGMYISMFPQLIAGPIVRYTDVENQLSCRSVNLCQFYEGLVRFVTGLAKKVLLANVLAQPADQIFALDPANISAGTAWLGAILYTMQIYFDFSGYSDMAIGMGKMLGFSFMENFNLPYLSKSISEFWRRWHISLSSWFRDYVYIPLGGNRNGDVYLNLLIVFALTGLWHGAAETFLVWGFWHGFFVVVERYCCMHHKIPRVPECVKRFYTLLIVVIGWVFFRADTLPYAFRYLGAMFSLAEKVVWFDCSYFADRFTIFILAAAVFCAAGLPRRLERMRRSSAVAMLIERIVLLALFFVCTVMTMASTYNPFIYFRF